MPGEMIGRYQVRTSVGRGGMATVYLAHDPSFGRDVAIKVLAGAFFDDDNWRARFDREARTIATLEHHAIVPVYDVGEQDGLPYLVMRLMPGGSLADRLRLGPLSAEDSYKILSRIAAALDAAHAAGIVHRDVKPANVLFDARGDAYLSDFGIARLAESGATLTGGSSIGTPGYMSPEQAMGEPATAQSDIYSLGVMAYELLAQRRPFQSATPAALLHMHAVVPPPPIREFAPWVPEPAEQVLAQALAKEPPRFASATAMVEMLGQALRGQANDPTALATAVGRPPEPLTMSVTPRSHTFIDRVLGRKQRYSVTVTNNNTQPTALNLRVESDEPATMIHAPSSVQLPPAGSATFDIEAGSRSRRWTGPERTDELRISATGGAGGAAVQSRAALRERPVGIFPAIIIGVFAVAALGGAAAIFALGGDDTDDVPIDPDETETVVEDETPTEPVEDETPTESPTEDNNGEEPTVEPTEAPIDPTVVSTDGRTPFIIFSAVSGQGPACAGVTANRDIYSFFPDSQELHRLTDHECDDRQPAISPDGTMVAFSSNRRETGGGFDIWVMDIDGANARRVTLSALGDFHPTWRGNNEIYFHRGATEGDIWKVDITTLLEEPVIETPGADDREPAISAGGEYLLWTSWTMADGSACPSGDEDFNVYQLNLTEAEAEPQQLTFEPCNEINPSWSPDGNAIVFQMQDGATGTADNTIFAYMNLSGEVEEIGLVVDSHDNREPSWSPDGTEVAYGREGEIWVADVATREIRLLAPRPDGTLDSQANVEWGLTPAE